MSARTSCWHVPTRVGIPGWMRVYERVTAGGWSIEIMPYEIRIDNFHGDLHVHPPREKGEPTRVPERSFADTRAIVYRHVKRRQGVVFAELLQELR